MSLPFIYNFLRKTVLQEWKQALFSFGKFILKVLGTLLYELVLGSMSVLHLHPISLVL